MNAARPVCDQFCFLRLVQLLLYSRTLVTQGLAGFKGTELHLILGVSRLLTT